MRFYISLLFAFIAISAMAQQPEDRVEVSIADDDAAMEVLRRYAEFTPDSLIPNVDFAIRAWRPHGLTFVIPPVHFDKLLWQQSAAMPMVVVSVPKFTDYNSIKLKIGGSGGASITISDGSAFNYMPWPNSPIGYRDARTLSFPLPR